MALIQGYHLIFLPPYISKSPHKAIIIFLHNYVTTVLYNKAPEYYYLNAIFSHVKNDMSNQCCISHFSHVRNIYPWNHILELGDIANQGMR